MEIVVSGGDNPDETFAQIRSALLDASVDPEVLKQLDGVVAVRVVDDTMSSAIARDIVTQQQSSISSAPSSSNAVLAVSLAGMGLVALLTVILSRKKTTPGARTGKEFYDLDDVVIDDDFTPDEGDTIVESGMDVIEL